MANRPSSSRPSSRPQPGRGGAQTGGRRRTPPPPVKKPFPWGVVAVSGVLGLLLLGILVYAVTNQGAGFIDPLKAADKKVPGVQKYSGLAQTHVTTNVTYPQSPPVGGKHNAVWQNCAVYTSPLANEHAVHSLEHGAVWVTYRPDLPATQLASLKAKVEGNPYRMLSPYPGLKTAVSMQAWGRQIFVNSASDSKVDKFFDAYTQGPQAPEQGSSCSGGTSATGPLQVAPAATATVAPSPGASTAASAAPSASPSK
ncbi:MAG: hypothetical protein QOE99_2771 [Actinomycetota bacterium]|jgi:hypothetical protein|nr:hypothetical protein [Actinomycetota bacterium]